MKDDSCSLKCSFVECVDNLNNVITKGSLSQIKQYVLAHCQTALFRKDTCGRFPLHVAASCGKCDVLEWIVSIISSKKINKIDINVVDEESGWSALHRAVYYGRISSVVFLLKNGADLWLKDKDFCNSLDIIVKDISPWYEEPVLKQSEAGKFSVQSWSNLSKTGPNEVYTWGSNENMTIGNKSASSKSIPEVVPFFVKKNWSIKKVAMSKFHSIFLTQCGRVYACGTGRDGRLGISKENIFIEPQFVQFEDKISDIAASIDHSVFVSDNGRLYTCGLNHFRVLGISPPPAKSVRPTCVGTLASHNIIGCAAGMCHTIAWSDKSLFTFGTNAGQLGHHKGDVFVILPREVSQFHGDEEGFVHIHTCDSATVVATTKGMIYLLHKYICFKILARHMDVVKVQIGGGRLDAAVLSQVKFFNVSQSANKLDEKQKTSENELKILILKRSGDVLAWSDSHNTISHCHFENKQLRWIRDIAISNNSSIILLISLDGTAYKAQYSAWTPGKKKSSARQEYFSSLELSQCDPVQLFTVRQIPSIFRAHTGVLGHKGKNFAALQSRPSNFITEVPVIADLCLKDDLKIFLQNTSEDDLVHDVIIRVRRRDKNDTCFASHLFILASQSQVISRMIKQNNEREDDQNQKSIWPDLVIENVHPEIFNDCLEYIYCGKFSIQHNTSYIDLGPALVYWENADVGSPTSNFIKQQKIKNKIVKTDQLTLVKSLLETLQITRNINPITKSLDSDDSDDNTTLPSYKPDFVLFPALCPHLYDCVVVCSDSLEFRAHKCILASRIPYFFGMLFSPWVEMDHNVLILKVPVPSDVFTFVLNFSYTDSTSCLDGAKSIEILCEILAAADLLLMDRLKQIAEAQIVPRLTLNNVASVCEVALAFNGNQLYKSCLQFCCHHLPALLQTPSFFSIGDSTLDEVEAMYRSSLSNAYMRGMPPSREGPNIDHLIDSAEEFVDDAAFLFDQLKLDLNSDSKRKKPESESYKRKSSIRFDDISSSNMLSTSKKSQEDKILVRIRQTSKEKKSKKRNKNFRLNANKEVESFEGAANTQKTNKNSDSPNKSSLAIDQSSRTDAQVKSYANYERLFPQLGADLPKPGWKPLSKQSVSGAGRSDARIESGSSGIEIVKVKKRKSKKEKRVMAGKSVETSPQIDVQKPNAWGVPLKTPEDYAGGTSSPISPDRLNSSFATASFPTLTTKPRQHCSDGAWQSPPIANFGSPPTPHHIHEAPGCLDAKPVSFIDIVHDELKSKEFLQQTKQKSIQTIQLEDTAMNELQKFYQSSNRSKGAFITVTRLPYDEARQITQSRKASLQKH